jgi:hypothetical protein
MVKLTNRPRAKTQFLLRRRLVGHQSLYGRFGEEENLLLLLGFESLDRPDPRLVLIANV